MLDKKNSMIYLDDIGFIDETLKSNKIKDLLIKKEIKMQKQFKLHPLTKAIREVLYSK